MKITKKNVRMQTPLVNPIISLERPLEKVLKKGKYIAIKCHNTHGDNVSGFYEINLLYNGGGSPEEWLDWKEKLLHDLDGQGVGKQSNTFTESFLTGDPKAIFNQAALDIGIPTVNHFNKVLLEMTKHAFPAYTFRE